MFNAFSIVREVAGVVAGATTKIPAIEKRFRISERLDGNWPEGPFLWLHGASLGECRMLLSLAGFLQQDLPGCPKILITAQKPEVVDFLKNSGKDIEAAMAPADTPTSLAKFISKVKPVGLVLGENELWPGYLSAMQRLSLKPSVAIVSGRFRRALPFMDYSPVGFAAMQTGADSSRIQAAFGDTSSTKAVIGGDWKLLSWAKAGKQVSAPENPTVDTVFLSMHFAEWASLSRMIISSIKRQESVVLVPRRLEEVETFRKALIEQELIVTEWPLVQKGAVSMVTKFGLVPEILKNSRSAVVGGSFSLTLGVHDFWEPLQNGVATCVGPYSRGQRETVCTLVREGVLTQIQTTAGFADRNKADIRMVQSFLERERLKISESYQQLLDFLKDLLQAQG